MSRVLTSLPISAPSSTTPTVTNIRDEGAHFVSKNFSEWKKEFQHLSFRVSNETDVTSRRVMTLDSFITQAKSKVDRIFDSASITVTSNLRQLIPIALPPVEISDLYAGYQSKLKLDMIWMIFGLQGARNPLHTDIWSTSTWNLLLTGHKEWEICSLDRSTHFRIQQNPGDVLHIPSGWAHEVRYKSDSVSITENYVQPELWDLVSEHQKYEGLLALSEITRKLGQSKANNKARESG